MRTDPAMGTTSAAPDPLVSEASRTLERAISTFRHGANLWSRDLDRFHELTMVGPYRSATREFDACITGRRRDQSDTRETLRTWDDGPPARINPLAPWSGAQVWHWIRRHDLPYNPLHDRGYASIGDEPLTSPARQGEPERAGRWRGLARSECGIHAPTMKQGELDKRRHDVPSDHGP